MFFNRWVCASFMFFCSFEECSVSFSNVVYSFSNQMMFTSFHVLVVNLPILENLYWKNYKLYWKNWPNTRATRVTRVTRVTRADSAIKGHFDNCLNVKHLFSINNLTLNDVNKHEFRLNLVRQNTRIIDESNNWNVLLFKEGYHIKEKCPILNYGVKASREMQLF